MRNALIVAASLLLAACARQEPPSQPQAGTKPPGFPDHAYDPRVGQVYRIDGAASLVEIRVFRGGRLARLGHNHVIEIRDLGGKLLLSPDGGQSRGDLYFPVSALVVDDPASRARAGEPFQSELSESDIAGTRANMLGEKLLDAANFPFVELRVRGLSGEGPEVIADAVLVVKSQGLAREIPLSLKQGDCQLSADGQLQLLQSELSLTPFSVLGGALAVQDEFSVSFHIVGRDVSGACRST
jgi:hypothetical protein